MSPRPAAVATAFLESTRAEDRFVEGATWGVACVSLKAVGSSCQCER